MCGRARGARELEREAVKESATLNTARVIDLLAADILCLTGCVTLVLEAVWRSGAAANVAPLRVVRPAAQGRAAPTGPETAAVCNDSRA